MDEHNIEGSFAKLRWVGDEDRQVWIYKQHNKDAEEDSRNKEPLENLVEVGISQDTPKGKTGIPK